MTSGGITYPEPLTGYRVTLTWAGASAMARIGDHAWGSDGAEYVLTVDGWRAWR